MPPATPQTPGTQTLDPSQDQDFLKASPSDQHNYLMATDPDYANASMKDKFAYLQHVNGLDNIDTGRSGLRATLGNLWESTVDPIKKLFASDPNAGKPNPLNPSVNPNASITTPVPGSIDDAVTSLKQSMAQRKADNRSLPYQTLADAAQATGIFDPTTMEEHARKGQTGEVIGDAASPILQTALPYIFHSVAEPIGDYARMKMEPGWEAEGKAKVTAAGDVSAGKGGRTGANFENDVNIAAPHLADIFRDSPIKATGDREALLEAADKIDDYKDARYDTGRGAVIDQYGDAPLNRTEQSPAYSEMTPEAKETDPAGYRRAERWLQGIDRPRTLGSAQSVLQEINKLPFEPNDKSVFNRVRQQFGAGLRDSIDSTVDGLTGTDSGMRAENQTYGALRNISKELRASAYSYDPEGATNLLGKIGDKAHGYVFAGPHGIHPGIGVNARSLMELSPADQIRQGTRALSKTSLTAPPPMGPGELTNKLLPAAPISSGPAPDTSGTPPGYQPPFKGGYPPLAENRQLPPAGGGSGPATSAGPGGGIFPTNPAASSGRVPSAIPVPERTPSPILPPERQLPPAGGTGTGGAPNSDVMAPKVGTQPLQPTQMPASPPQATVSPYLTGKHDFAIIPAETPVHRAIAMKELRGQGYHPQVITGASEGQPGTSLFIPDMPTHAALDFQQHMTSSYGQQTPQSIITKQGLINLDRGTATPIDFSRTIFGPDAAAKPSYSIATGGSESMPFALNPNGKEIPIKTPYEGEHYSDTVPAGAKRISGSRGVQASPDAAARLQVSPNDAVPRVYFQDKGTVAMGPTGKNVHAFKGELSIADISTNPTYKNAYIQAAQEAQSKGVPPNAIKAFARTKAESALQQAGWDGYRNPKFPGITAKFGDADVFKPGEEPEAPPLEPHPNAPEPTVQPAPSPTSRGASAKPSAPKRIANNGSGGGPNSLEAQGRVKAENAKGIQRFRIDTRSGQATPIMNTVDAADVRPGPFDVIVQRQGGTETVQDRGIRATYPFPSGQKWR